VARELGNLAWEAIQAVKQGLSANKFVQALRETGQGVARATGLRLFAQAKADLAAEGAEITRPLDRKPLAREIRAYETKVQSGYMQYVDVYVKDRATGDVYPVPYGIRTDVLLTRSDAIATALDQYGRHAEKYNQQVLGATYTSTYLFAPPEQ